MLAPPAPPPALEERLRQALADRENAGQSEPLPALLTLAERLGLSAFERDTLLLSAAPEFDPGFASLFAKAQGATGRNYPTFALALWALDDPAWDAISAWRPLRFARLIEVSQPGATPLTASPIRADERVVDYLKGLNVLDHRLATILTQVTADGADLSDSQQAVLEDALERLHHAAASEVLPVLQLIGTDDGSKLALARRACDALDRQLYRLHSEALPAQASEIETFGRLWQRESLLLPVALYIDADGAESLPAETQAAFQRFLARQVGMLFLSVREAPVRFGGESINVETPKPTPAEQHAAWTEWLGKEHGEDEARRTAELLVGQYNLNFSDIRQVASETLRLESEWPGIRDGAWDRCRDLTRPKLDALAQRLDARATWADLVLPEEQMVLMRQIAGQVRERHRVYGEWGFGLRMNRGFGISALFAGESGTGKSMAAEVIANALRLNLYRIDISAVVSKYIGETEKNLRKLFDAAEQGGAILFFDEADALFGKRSEVKDSHDRYANIEINYLLQRMEAFSGLAILATNMKAALDPAFLRRLRFIVNFQFPGPKERAEIWARSLPPETPRDGIDYSRLARLNITGGNIHSIALNAAFRAAEKREPVTMPLLLAAARAELKKLDKPFSEAEFRV